MTSLRGGVVGPVFISLWQKEFECPQMRLRRGLTEQFPKELGAWEWPHLAFQGSSAEMARATLPPGARPVLLRSVTRAAALTLKAYKALGGQDPPGAQGPRKMQVPFSCRPATPHTNIY